MKAGVTINRPPRDGKMAFVRSPDKHSIELLQKGAAAAAEGAMGLDAQYRANGEASAPPAACLPAYGKPLYISRSLHAAPICARLRALRLAVQDAALSRRKHGFDSRRARQVISMG